MPLPTPPAPEQDRTSAGDGVATQNATMYRQGKFRESTLPLDGRAAKSCFHEQLKVNLVVIGDSVQACTQTTCTQTINTHTHKQTCAY